MKCLVCGKRLPLFRKLPGEYCSAEHQEAHEQSQREALVERMKHAAHHETRSHVSWDRRKKVQRGDIAPAPIAGPVPGNAPAVHVQRQFQRRNPNPIPPVLLAAPPQAEFRGSGVGVPRAGLVSVERVAGPPAHSQAASYSAGLFNTGVQVLVIVRPLPPPPGLRVQAVPCLAGAPEPDSLADAVPCPVPGPVPGMIRLRRFYAQSTPFPGLRTLQAVRGLQLRVEEIDPSTFERKFAPPQPADEAPVVWQPSASSLPVPRLQPSAVQESLQPPLKGIRPRLGKVGFLPRLAGSVPVPLRDPQRGVFVVLRPAASSAATAGLPDAAVAAGLCLRAGRELAPASRTQIAVAAVRGGASLFTSSKPAAPAASVLRPGLRLTLADRGNVAMATQVDLGWPRVATVPGVPAAEASPVESGDELPVPLNPMPVLALRQYVPEKPLPFGAPPEETKAKPAFAKAQTKRYVAVAAPTRPKAPVKPAATAAAADPTAFAGRIPVPCPYRNGPSERKNERPREVPFAVSHLYPVGPRLPEKGGAGHPQPDHQTVVEAPAPDTHIRSSRRTPGSNFMSQINVPRPSGWRVHLRTVTAAWKRAPAPVRWVGAIFALILAGFAVPLPNPRKPSVRPPAAIASPDGPAEVSEPGQAAPKAGPKQPAVVAGPVREPDPEIPAVRRSKPSSLALSGRWRTFKENISSRAAVVLADDFRAGLGEWSGEGNWAKSWAYDQAGFVRPGALALYTPTVYLSDYKLEFLGQIDRQALSWVVRAADFRNYNAIKLVVTESGPLPKVALVSYPVIRGRAGPPRRVQLPFPVRNETSSRVQVEVQGDRVAVTIQDTLVDSWSEARLPGGGVGFFGGRGELARVRWVGVTHQDDFLGKLCALLAPPNLGPKLEDEEQ